MPHLPANWLIVTFPTAEIPNIHLICSNYMFCTRSPQRGASNSLASTQRRFQGPLYFWINLLANFDYQISVTNQSAVAEDQKIVSLMSWWYLLFFFSFFILHVQTHTHTKWYFPNFAGKCSKMRLKINWKRRYIWCFPFCQTNQLETSGIIKRKWNDISQLKQSFQSNQAIHLHFDRKFDYWLAT